MGRFKNQQINEIYVLPDVPFCGCDVIRFIRKRSNKKNGISLKVISKLIL
jgi:hypothetical protein